MNHETLKILSVFILLAPLAGAIVTAALGPTVLRARSHWPVIAGVGAAFFCSLILFSQVRGFSVDHHAAAVPVYDWILSGTPSPFRVEFLIDPLTSVMLMTVTGVSLLVVIYSRDYMRDHGRPVRGYERFFAFLGLFVFSMCVLVLGGNFILLYLGWEAVGLCSYLLIGFYYDKPSAAAAAKKAFIVNRVGDFGFGLAIFLIYLTFGTLDYQAVFQQVPTMLADGSISQDRLTAIALLLMCGACGKSAQLPLHVWLPDAMEGPSPVSALIHAATMVTAGIYMIARCGAIFAASSTAMTVVTVIGGVTAFFAATIALTQTDMKRVLAYSTISQLGYMVLGAGCFAADSAIFHLFTHAFFKALLFLAAGSVMHALGGIIDLRQFGGLRALLPWTYRTFLIGSLALAGFPLLSGFFSKDEIIHHALTVHPALGVLALVTAFLTAFYTFRMFFMAFHGEERIPKGAHPHESGSWMLVPLGILALGAILAGYVGLELTGKGFHHFLEPVFHSTFAAHAPHEPAHVAHGFWVEYGLMLFSGALSIVGIASAYFAYIQQRWVSGLLRATFPKVYKLLWNKWYVDELYDAAFVRPAHGLGRFCVALDDYFVDGLLWVMTAIPRGLAYMLRGLQSGVMQAYALTMIGGIAAILILVS